MFPPAPDYIPFNAFDQLTEALDSCLNAIENLFTNSFQNFYFTYPDNPVSFVIHWSNGSVTTSPNVDLNFDYLSHLQSFALTTDFLLMTLDSTLTGCTRWFISFGVEVQKGSYLFGLRPIITRSSCPESVINVGPPIVHSTISSANRVIRNHTAQNRFHYSRSASYVQTAQIPTFNRTELGLYHTLARVSLFLLICSSVSVILQVITLGRAFQYHLFMKSTNAIYMDLESYEQFHSVIGFWEPLGLLTSLIAVAASVALVVDVTRLTQFPSQSATVLFGLGAFFSVTQAARWLRYFPHCYSAFLIIRHAFVKIIFVGIGIAPIVFGMTFIGVFLFGLVSDVAESMIKIFEAILSVTFGDMILRAYLSFTDGSSEYNLLAFVYVSIMVACAMWIFFTAFTAQTVLVYRRQLSYLFDTAS
jgi:hypothetical protein